MYKTSEICVCDLSGHTYMLCMCGEIVMPWCLKPWFGYKFITSEKLHHPR
jgi:hypothetical protein